MPDQANNVNAHKGHEERAYLSDPFDKTAVWDEQCSPLVQQVFDICKEHDIPLLVLALHGFERNEGVAETRQARSIHLPGPHRVPYMFSIAAKLFEDPEYYQFVENMSQLYALQQFGDAGEQEE